MDRARRKQILVKLAAQPDTPEMQAARRDYWASKPGSSGQVESQGIGLGAAVNNVAGTAAAGANNLTGGWLGRMTGAAGRGAWNAADTLQRGIYGDPAISQYNRQGGMQGAAAAALGPTGLRVAGEVGTTLGDATALMGLPKQLSAIGQSGLQAGRETLQLGRAVGQEVRGAADTMAGLAGPRPAFATASAGAPPQFPKPPPMPGIVGAQGIARSRLGQEIASGNLSEQGRQTAQQQGWVDPERAVSGIERGTENLKKRFGIQTNADPSIPVSADVGVGAAADPSKLNEGASSPAWRQLGRVQAGATPQPTIYTGQIDQTAQRWAGQHAGVDTPASSLDRRGIAAVMGRHEVDEVRLGMRAGNPRTGAQPTFRPPQMEQVQTPVGGRLRPVDQNLVTPGQNGSQGFTLHEHPDVLRRESANANQVGGLTRDTYQTLRMRTGESDALLRAMPQGLPQQASREAAGGYARAWQPNKTLVRRANMSMAQDPALVESRLAAR